MKYSKEDVQKITGLVDQCLADPEIEQNKYLNRLLGELNQKLKYNKRFKKTMDLRKEAGVFARKHGFKMPVYLNELLEALNDLTVTQGSKHGWLQAFHNWD